MFSVWRRRRPRHGAGSQSDAIAAPLRVRRSDRTLSVSGDLDRVTADELYRALAGVGVGDVTLDLDDVERVDEAGLRVLIIEAQERLRTGHNLTLLNPSSGFQRQLEERGLLKFFRVDEP
jgi:anti-anti-sigma factor